MVRGHTRTTVLAGSLRRLQRRQTLFSFSEIGFLRCQSCGKLRVLRLGLLQRLVIVCQLVLNRLLASMTAVRAPRHCRSLNDHFTFARGSSLALGPKLRDGGNAQSELGERSRVLLLGEHPYHVHHFQPFKFGHRE